MNDKSLPPYRVIDRQFQFIVIGSNAVGALLTTIYYTFIDPIPVQDGLPPESVVFRAELWITLLGIVLLLVVGGLLGGFAGRYHPKWWERIRAGESPADMPDAARREVLNFPFYNAFTSGLMWLLAGFFMGYLPGGGWGAFWRIVGVGGVLTTALVYYSTTALWERYIPFFFPDGRLSVVPGALRLSVFTRLLIVFILVGFYPAVMLSIASFSRLMVILDSPNPRLVSENMAVVLLFILGVSFVFGMSLIALVTSSIVRPLRELQSEMSKVERDDLSAQVLVRTRDELGYLSERFNDMVSGLRRAELLRNLLNVYVSPEVVQEALEHGTRLGGQLAECSVLFSDIRGFTSLSEQLPPEKLIELLNRYMSRMVEVIVRHGGMVNKFGGDSLLAVFGTPLNPAADHALRALQAAHDMGEALRQFNVEQRANGLPELQIGVGVASGPVVAGNIGGEGRIEYTVIGDTVNLASRLQSITKEVGRDILVSGAVYDAARAPASYPFETLPPIAVRGKAEPVRVFALSFNSQE